MNNSLSNEEYETVDNFSQLVNALCMPIYDIIANIDDQHAAQCAYKHLSKMIDSANSAVDVIEKVMNK